MGGHKHTIAPPRKKVGGHMPPLPPRFLRQCIYINTISSLLQLCINIINKLSVVQPLS